VARLSYQRVNNLLAFPRAWLQERFPRKLGFIGLIGILTFIFFSPILSLNSKQLIGIVGLMRLRKRRRIKRSASWTALELTSSMG
jgi:hypothetical protein